jgi:STAM-binding protein
VTRVALKALHPRIRSLVRRNRTNTSGALQGQLALQDSDYPRAYLMLFRHGRLVIEHLQTHPEYVFHKPVIAGLYRRQENVFVICERIKPYIKKEHDEWEARRRSWEVRRRQQNQQQQQQQRAYEQERPARLTPDPNTASRGFGVRMLSAADHQDLAVDLAREEMDRRAKRRAGDWEAFRYVPPNEEEFDLRQQMQAARRQLDGREIDADRERKLDWQRQTGREAQREHEREQERRRDSMAWRPSSGSTTQSVYDYPVILRPGQHSMEPTRATSTDKNGAAYPQLPPPHPPKEYAPRSLQAPLIPSKEPLTIRHVPAPDTLQRPSEPSPYSLPIRPPKESLPLRPPSPAASAPGTSLGPPSTPSRKDRVSFRPSAHLEDGSPLRPVFLPADLRSKFLAMAAENTRRGIEMCGMLCGSPVNNALFVSCLVIPDQTCTSDTCETQNEDTMLAYCMERDLMVIGWIHTHPTQSCFMSSRDLHTHSGYQVMMPESIAIVCAPRSTPSYGIFRLTKPPGLDHILSCERKETFHPHSMGNLYVEAEHPGGHVYETSKLKCEVHDLRENRF